MCPALPSTSNSNHSFMSLCYSCGLPLGVSAFKGGCICNLSAEDPFKRALREGRARFDYKPRPAPMKRKLSATDFEQKRKAARDKRQRLSLLRAPAVSSTTAQAIRTGGWANPSRGGELKFVDTSITTAIAFGSAAFTAGTLLNGLANGSDASTRIGRKVNIKSLLIRWSFATATTTTWDSNFRILVVYDKQANAAAPAITDILLTDNFNSQNNLSNRDRFITLADFMTPRNVGGSNNSCVAADNGVIFKKLNLETMFNAGSAGTIGDITSGSIYYFVAQTGAALVANIAQSTRVRIRYTDI